MTKRGLFEKLGAVMLIGFLVGAGLTVLLTYTAEPVEAANTAPFYIASFENSPQGWGMENLWHRAGPSSPLQATDGSWCMWYARSDTWYYNTVEADGTPTRNWGNLTSPMINDMAINSYAYLYFDYFAALETGRDPNGFEDIQVYIKRQNDADWNLIGSLPDSKGQWRTDQMFDISAYTGQLCELRFWFDSRDNISNDFMGWAVDNIRIYNQRQDVSLVFRSSYKTIEKNDLTQNYTWPMLREGYIEFDASEDNVLRGVDLGLEQTDYVVTPGTPVSVKFQIKNLGDSPATCRAGLSIYNRFGVEVFGEVDSYNPGPRGTPGEDTITVNYTWTPMLSDQYVVLPYVVPSGDQFFPDPFDIQPDTHNQYRVLKVYDPLLFEDAENFVVKQVYDSDEEYPNDWIKYYQIISGLSADAYNLTGAGYTNDGDWIDSTSNWHSKGKCLQGGEFYLSAQRFVQRLRTPIIDFSDLYPIYGFENSYGIQYPEVLETDDQGKLKLFMTFFYLYRGASGINDFGDLEIRFMDDGGPWTNWNPVWNTTNESSVSGFDPENKNEWVGDYSRDIPVRVDITSYIPDDKDVSRQVQFRFSMFKRAGALYNGATWWLDDITVGAIVPSSGLTVENSTDSPQIVAKGGTGVFQFNAWNAPSNAWNSLEVIPSFVEPVGDGWLAEALGGSGESLKFSLAANNSRLVVIEATCNNTAINGTYHINVLVRMTAGHDPGILIDEKAITLVMKVGKGNVTVTVENSMAGTTKSVKPGHSVDYEVKVKSDKLSQTVDITLGMSPTHLPAGWTATLAQKSFNDVLTGETRNTTLTVTCPLKDDKLPGDYVLVTLVANNSVLNATGVPEYSNVVVVNTTVDVNYGFNLTVKDAQKSVSVGKSVPFNLYILNWGNVKDNVTLDLISYPAGWSMDVAPGPYVLQPYEETFVTIKAIVPEDEVAGVYQIVINGTSENVPAMVKSLTLNVSVSVYHDVDLVLQVAAGYPELLDLGDSVKYPVKIYNNGTFTDSVNLEIQQYGSDPAYEWATLDPYSVDRVNQSAPNETEVTIDVPDDTAVSMAGLHRFIVYGAAASSADPVVDDSVEVLFWVEEVADVHVEVPSIEQDQDVKRGGWVNYTLQVTNYGNFRDTMVITEDGPEDWDYELEANGFELDPQASRDVMLTVAIPADEESGDYNITITVMSANDVSATHTTWIEGTVTASYGVHVYSDDPSETVDPAETASYVINVKNTGNSQDIFEIELQGAYADWGKLDGNTTRSVQVPAGGEKTVTMTVAAPENALAGSYVIDVIATSTLDSAAVAYFSTTTVVRQVYDLNMVIESEDTQLGKPGDSLNYEVSVENLGNGNDSVRITVDSEHHSWVDIQSIVDLGPFESKTLSFQVKIPDSAEGGNYTFKLTATPGNGTESSVLTEFYVNVEVDEFSIWGLTWQDLLLIAVVVVIIAVVVVFTGKPKAPKGAKAPRPPAERPQPPATDMMGPKI